METEASASNEAQASTEQANQGELTSEVTKDPKVAELEEKLEFTLRQLAASDNKVRELSTDLKVIKENAELNAKVDYLTRTTELASNLQSGHMDNATYGDAAAKLKAEYETKLKTIQAQQTAQAYAQKAFTRIEKQLKRAGLDPNSTDPAVEKIKTKFSNAKTPDDLEAAVDMAEALADSKLSAPDIAKLKEQVAQELKEEQKKKLSKVDTGTPSGTGGARRITVAELEKMTPMEYAKAVKEGRIKL